MEKNFKLNQVGHIVKDVLATQLENKFIFVFRGPLGAGKTTLIKEFLKYCGVNEIVTSPTFTYVNIYKNHKNQTFNHFDLYRLSSLDSFLEMGFDEYLYSSISEKRSWNLIEWPEIIDSLLADVSLNKYVCNIELCYGKSSDLSYRVIKIS